jgi:hypothetical protein
MNLPPEEQLTSQDIHLLRSLLGRFGGQLNPAPSTLAPPSTASMPAPPSMASGPSTLAPSSTPALPGPSNPSALQPLTPSQYPIPSESAVQPPTQYPILSAMHPPTQYPIPSAMQRPPTPHPAHSFVPPITPYHSALPGAQGHPPRSTGISTTVQNIGSGITSQINRQRLAAAAANLPSQTSLAQRTARRRCRGPAISPPTLTSTFSINSVLSNEGSDPLIRIKVKVYPPQVSVSLCIFLIHLN